MDMRIQKRIFIGGMILLMSSFAFSDEDRHLPVDREIGGMEQGSRIGTPASTPNRIVDTHKTISSSQVTQKAGAGATQPTSAKENHGNIYTYTGESNTAGSGSNGNESGTNGSQQTQPGETQTGETQTGTTETSGSVEVNTGQTGGETGTGGTTNPVDTGSNESPTEQISNPSGENTSGTGETSMETGGSEPTTGTGSDESSGNPIVETEVTVNPESGTVESGATVDTSGELEDKQIFDADLGAQDVASVDTEVGSASEITGQEAVEGADVTTSGQTGQTSGSTQVETGETTTQETTNPLTTESGSTTGGTQEPSSNPIVDADVNVNPESGTVETGATVDTSGELEEKQIIDADLGAGETTAETEVGSATDVTHSDIVESADITTQPVQSVIPIPSDLTAEVDTTGETGGGETDVGVEADVSGMSEGEDVTCDPADGLLSTSVCADLKL